ncbi:MAG: ATP-binding protein [Pseudomonadota bacterium]
MTEQCMYQPIMPRDRGVDRLGIGRWSYSAKAGQFTVDATTARLLNRFSLSDRDVERSEFLDLFEPSSRNALDAQLQYALQGTDPNDVYVHLAATGAPVQLLSRCCALETGVDGVFFAVPSVEADVVSVAEPIEQGVSEKLIRALETQDRGIMLVDSNMRIEFANQNAVGRFAKTPEEVCGMQVSTLLGPRIFPVLAKAFKNALDGARQARDVKRTNGEYVRVFFEPVLTADRVSGVFVQTVNATQIYQLKDQLAHILKGVPNVFYYVDKNLIYRYVNDELLKRNGMTSDEFIGRSVPDLVGERFRLNAHHYDRALNGESVTFESYSDVDGKTQEYMRVRFEPDFDSQGRVVGIFCEATDITDLHRLQCELEAKQLELSRSNKDLEQFAYVASHDLKAPLRAIQAIVYWLREDLAEIDAPDVLSHLDLLEQRAERLQHLLEDLLEYSRVGRTEADVERTSLKALVDQVTSLMSLPDSFSVVVNDTVGDFDTLRAPLEQVLRNLIGNACKHHPRQDGVVTVSICDEGDHFLVSVEDDGDGIDEQFRDRVFGMFQTLKPRDSVEGSGIGLAIVARIVELQGGKVWIDAPDGKSGCVFKLEWRKDIAHSKLVGKTS